MPSRGPLGHPALGLVCAVLLSLCPSLLSAAAPPGSVHDTRRVWQGDEVRFQLVSPGRWDESGPRGRVTYRENNRHADYVELFEPAQKRYVRLYSFGHYVYVPEKEHFKRTNLGGWGAGRQRPLDLTRNSSDRYHLVAEEQKRSFPRLGNRFEVLGPATVTYNCICWSIGNDNSWVWPREPGQPVSLADFDGLYGIYGYKRIDGLDLAREAGVEKVVVFALVRDGRLEMTHAARQNPDGTWSSKLGSLPLIRHLRPDDLSGPTYGQPYVVYVKKR